MFFCWLSLKCITLYTYNKGRTENLENIFADSNYNPLSIASGFYGGLFCYDGWNNLNFLTEEIINPRRNMPLSALISVPLITVIYTLVNFSYFIVIPKQEFLASDAVALVFLFSFIFSLNLILLLLLLVEILIF